MKFSELLAASLAVCIVMTSESGLAAAAKDLRVRIDDCDADRYPRIVCQVAVQDEGGRPVENLQAHAFNLTFDERTVGAMNVTSTVGTPARSHMLLVLDDGVLNRTRYSRRWRAAAASVLRELPAGHGVTVVYASQAHEFAVPHATSNLHDVGSLVQEIGVHELTVHARLFDALCDAAARVAYVDRPSVWVAVVSDGLDRGSTVCDLHHAEQQMVRARVPVLAIGVGPYAGELRRIAAETNGLFVDAGENETGSQALAEVMNRAQRRYRVEFAVGQPADGQAHAVAVTVRNGGASSRDVIDVEALPLAPTMVGVDMSADGKAVSPSHVPLHRRVRVEARFVARGESVVEFVLDGRRTRIDAVPYVFEFDGASLPTDRPSTLSVTVFGMTGTAAASQAIVLAPEGSAAAYRLDPGGAGARAWFAGSVGSLAIGTTLALLLGALLASLHRSPLRWALAMRGALAPSRQPRLEQALLDAPTLVSHRSDVWAQPVEPSDTVLHLLLRGPAAAVERRVLTGPAVLGRAAAGALNEIAIASSFLSLRHVRFAPSSAGWQIEDLHSVNGVRCNGRALGGGAVMRITAGDRIECADVVVEVESVGLQKSMRLADRGDLGGIEAHAHSCP